MSSRLDALAGRRAVLIDRSDRDRAVLAAAVGSLERQLAVADVIVATVRRVHRHRALVGAVAALLILAPLAARTWVRRAMWVLPLVIEGYRAVKSLRGAHPASGPD